jgi:hypothetical protein
MAIQPRVNGIVAEICLVTGPWIVSQVLNDSGVQRISMYVSTDLEEIVVFVDQNRLVSPTKQWSIGNGAPIVSLRVDTVYVAHGSTEIGAWSTQQQMIMVVHKAVGVTLHAKDLANLADQVEKQSAAETVWKDDTTTGTTVHDMVPGALEFDAQRA